jgi:N-dimethylarginine dimethylaminohydrolase
VTVASFVPSVRSETAPLQHALVHEPGDEFTDVVDPDAWGWKGLPRQKRARKEHRALVETLEDHGVEVHELGETGAGLAESLFVRDVGFALEGGVVVGNMYGEIRHDEPHVLTERVVELGVPVYHTVHGPGRFEAGNMVWLDEETVAVGRSMTTNAEGLRQVRSVLDTYGIELVEVPIFGSTESTGQTHLALVFGVVAPDLALVYPQAIPAEFRDLLHDRGVDTIDVPRREQRRMATSTVALEPGHVLLPGGVPETSQALCDRGIEVTEVDIREIRKAVGGLKGLVLPLRRASE